MTNHTLLTEAKHHLDRLAELAVAIQEQGLAGEAAVHLATETPADYANGVALLGRSAAHNANYRQEYETLVAELGYKPTLDVQGFINLELREGLAAALQTALTL